jgi:SAM-dependent methyltransferase
VQTDRQRDYLSACRVVDNIFKLARAHGGRWFKGTEMSEIEVNYHFIDAKRGLAHHDKNRSTFQRIYGNYLRSEPGLSGRVLDIGCGHSVNRSYEVYADRLGRLDGVDPFPAIAHPEHLVNRWSCKLEDIPVSSCTYDMAYSYMVAEHIKDIRPFLKKAIEIIKPGAAYWSMSPNAGHPFTWVTRIVQRLGMTTIYRKYVNAFANDYPAYYNLSNDAKILNAINHMRLPVSRVDFYYLPNVQWDMYFPTKLRWIPHFLDRTILLRKPRMSFILIFRIQKSS